MGSWIGREGKGYQAWSTYHLSPKSSIQVAVRNAKISNDFIPGGSTQWDWSISGDLWPRKDLEIKPFRAVRNLVGAGIGSYPTERFHQFRANHLVADNLRRPPSQPLTSSSPLPNSIPLSLPRSTNLLLAAMPLCYKRNGAP